MPRAKTAKATNFEQAFEELQQVVEKLEAGDLSLEQSLALFERGQALAAQCADLLDKAELQLKSLAGEDLALVDEEDELDG